MKINLGQRQQIDSYLVGEKDADGQPYALEIRGQAFTVKIAGEQVAGYFFNERDAIHIWVDGHFHKFRVVPEGAIHAQQGGQQNHITAELPGKVIDVLIRAGAKVKRGDALVLQDAMKMEHTHAAPRDGRIKAVFVKAGEQVKADQKLAELEDEKD